MESKDIVRQNVIRLIDDIYFSYKDFEAEMGLKPNTVTEWKRGRSNTFLNILPEIADDFEVTIDSLFNRDNTIEKENRIPIIGSIRAGYPIQSFESVEGYIHADLPNNDFFALRVIGDSMLPLVMEGDIIVLDKNVEKANGKICAVTIDNESTLKRVRIDSTGITLYPTNPIYPEFHYSKAKAEELDLRIDGVLTQMIRNF